MKNLITDPLLKFDDDDYESDDSDDDDSWDEDD